MQWEQLDAAVPVDSVPSDDAGATDLAILARPHGTLLARCPGSHWADTTPPGGDFDVLWSYSDEEEMIDPAHLFHWVEGGVPSASTEDRVALLDAIAGVTLDGEEPAVRAQSIAWQVVPDAQVFLTACQLLAMAEHRRFADYEAEGGGRRLVGELLLGLLLERWSSEEAANAAASGHLGLKQLRTAAQARGIFPDFPEYVRLLRESGAVTVDRIDVATESDLAADETEMRAKALETLRTFAGPTADFHAQQWEAIAGLVVETKRILLVQRTGWGKSAVYFIATRLLRDRGRGPTILISPLLSLMRNQVEMATRAGIRAVTLNSSNENEHLEVYRRIAANEIDLLLVTPEWVARPEFRSNVLPSLNEAGLIVIDEIHCVSDWGHDFRPDYRRLVQLVEGLNSTVPVLGTTATATKRVVLDVEGQFGDTFEILRGSLARPGLSFAVHTNKTKADRLARTLALVQDLQGTGIVYCLTISEAEKVAEFLAKNGVEAQAYHAQLDDADRIRVENELLASDVKVVVATSALGMGFDKPDIGFVVHFQSPASIVEYYQQAGRAGRGIPTAHAVLFVGAEDEGIHAYFASTAFITEREARSVLMAVGGRQGVTLGQIQSALNMETARIDKALKLLEVEGAVEKAGAQWRTRDTNWTYDHSRPERVSAQRKLERYAILNYAASTGCRQRFLLEQLDDPEPFDCGECDRCLGEAQPATQDDSAAAAERYLASAKIWIRPKEQTPFGAPGKRFFVPRHAFGRGLCYFGEGDVGRRIAECIDAREFDTRAIELACELIARWSIKSVNKPAWVTSVPKDSGGQGLERAARLIADELDLPFREGLRKSRRTTAELALLNDIQRYENLSFAFNATSKVYPRPVLLVDDYFASGWTFAMASWTLRKADVQAVVPFAFARVQQGSQMPTVGDPVGTPASRPPPRRSTRRGVSWATDTQVTVPRSPTTPAQKATLREVSEILGSGGDERTVMSQLGLSRQVAAMYVSWAADGAWHSDSDEAD